MGLHLGGEKAWHTASKGDIGLAMHWVNGEPAMCLFPLHRSLKNAAAYIIPLDNMHEIVLPETHGEGVDSQALLHKATKAAEVMGFGADFGSIKNICDLILDNVDKLVDMPPEPQELRDKKPKQGFVMRVRQGGKLIGEHEI